MITLEKTYGRTIQNRYGVGQRLDFVIPRVDDVVWVLVEDVLIRCPSSFTLSLEEFRKQSANISYLPSMI